MVRLLAVALAIVAARATDDASRDDLYKKKEPHASVTNELTELRLDADSKGELASASGDMAVATEHLKGEVDFEHAEKLIGYIDKNTPPDVVKQQAQFRSTRPWGWTASTGRTASRACPSPITLAPCTWTWSTRRSRATSR